MSKVRTAAALPGVTVMPLVPHHQCGAFGFEGRGVFNTVFPSRSLVASDLDSFRRQESILIALNLLILIVLFSLLYFADCWGNPKPLADPGGGNRNR